MTETPPRRRALCVGLTPAIQRTLWFSVVEKGAVNRAVRNDVRLAGKGVNVAFMLHALGGAAELVAFRYRKDTWHGLSVPEECAASWINVDAPARTCMTLIETDGTVTELVEEAPLPGPDAWATLDDAVRLNMSMSNSIALSGALMPGADPSIYARWIEMAHQNGIPALIDSQGEPLLRALEKKPRWVKPTHAELQRTLNRAIEDAPNAIILSAHELCERGAQTVLVTRGGHEAIWVDAKGGQGTIHPPEISVVNPIGAGDAVSAGMLWAFQRGENDLDILKWGIACGSARASVAHAGELDASTVCRLFESMPV